LVIFCFFFFFSSRRRHTRFSRDWSSDVCSSDLLEDDDHLVGLGTTGSRVRQSRPLGPSGASRIGMFRFADRFFTPCSTLPCPVDRVDLNTDFRNYFSHLLPFGVITTISESWWGLVPN